MIKHQLIIGAALVAGVAIGYFMAPSGSPATAKETEERVPKSKIADVGETAMVSSLRSRIAKLERMLAASREIAKGSVSNAVADVERRRDAMPRFRPGEFLENLKKTDPERYAKITERFAKFRQKQAARAKARVEFLASIDTSSWSKSAKKTHNDMQDLIARREELEEAMHQEGISEDTRRELMDEMRATDRQLRETGRTERKNLMDEVAKSVGLEGEMATALTETVRDIYDATGTGRGGPHDPPPGDSGGAGAPPPMN